MEKEQAEILDKEGMLVRLEVVYKGEYYVSTKRMSGKELARVGDKAWNLDRAIANVGAQMRSFVRKQVSFG